MKTRARPLRAAVAAGVMLALFAAVQQAGADPVEDRAIQPGARLTRPDVEPTGDALPYKFYRCTLTFIFRDASDHLYTGTTGESQCVPNVGARTYDENGQPFGTAVFQEFAPPAGSFTLILIDSSRYGAVNPAVRHWGGPTGIAAVSEVNEGDIVLFIGQAFVEGDVAQTQPRAGVLLSYDATHFTADTPAELGDSGAPIIEESTGRAVGMVSDFGTDDMPPTTDDGPTVPRILSDLAAHGFDLTLVTAPYSPPI